MTKTNYNDEKYLDTSLILFNKLNEISEILVKNFETKGKHYMVKQIGNRTDFKKLFSDFTNDCKSVNFKGIYAFATINNEFMYIGISETIMRRFFGHTRGKEKNKASWAYKMMMHENSNTIEENQERVISKMKFTFHLIEDNMLLHIAEVYCANKLKSHWNSFRTVPNKKSNNPILKNL